MSKKKIAFKAEDFSHKELAKVTGNTVGIRLAEGQKIPVALYEAIAHAEPIRFWARNKSWRTGNSKVTVSLQKGLSKEDITRHDSGPGRYHNNTMHMLVALAAAINSVLPPGSTVTPRTKRTPKPEAMLHASIPIVRYYLDAKGDGFGLEKVKRAVRELGIGVRLQEGDNEISAESMHTGVRLSPRFFDIGDGAVAQISKLYTYGVQGRTGHANPDGIITANHDPRFPNGHVVYSRPLSDQEVKERRWTLVPTPAQLKAIAQEIATKNLEYSAQFIDDPETMVFVVASEIRDRSLYISKEALTEAVIEALKVQQPKHTQRPTPPASLDAGERELYEAVFDFLEANADLPRNKGSLNKAIKDHTEKSVAVCRKALADARTQIVDHLEARWGNAPAPKGRPDAGKPSAFFDKVMLIAENDSESYRAVGRVGAREAARMAFRQAKRQLIDMTKRRIREDADVIYGTMLRDMGRVYTYGELDQIPVGQGLVGDDGRVFIRTKEGYWAGGIPDAPMAHWSGNGPVDVYGKLRPIDQADIIPLLIATASIGIDAAFIPVPERTMAQAKRIVARLKAPGGRDQIDLRAKAAGINLGKSIYIDLDGRRVVIQAIKKPSKSPFPIAKPKGQAPVEAATIPEFKIQIGKFNSLGGIGGAQDVTMDGKLIGEIVKDIDQDTSLNDFIRGYKFESRDDRFGDEYIPTGRNSVRYKDGDSCKAHTALKRKIRDRAKALKAKAEGNIAKPATTKPAPTTADVQEQLLKLMGQMQVIRERIANAIKAGKSQSGIDVYQAGLKALQKRADGLKAQR